MSRVACCLGIYDNGERERGVMEPVQDGGRAAGWTIAAITIGQTPRNDIVPELKTLMRLSSGLEHPVSLLEFGALDGLSEDEIQGLAPQPGDQVLVTRLRDGRSVKVSEERLYPLVEGRVSQASRCADVILLLCTGSFGDLAAPRPLLRPDRILLATALSVAGDDRLGVLTPDEAQRHQQTERWKQAARRMGFRTAVSVVALSPYGASESAYEIAGRSLSTCDLVVMDCIGYDLRMKEIIRQASGRPVFLARSVLARVASELLNL